MTTATTSFQYGDLKNYVNGSFVEPSASSVWLLRNHHPLLHGYGHGAATPSAGSNLLTKRIQDASIQYPSQCEDRCNRHVATRFIAPGRSGHPRRGGDDHVSEAPSPLRETGITHEQ